MRRNLLLQIATMILLVSLSSCDWDIFGKNKKFSKPKDMVHNAKEKAGEMAGEMDKMVKSFDPNDPQFEGMTEEEIRAKELESGLFDELTEMQDEAMGKLSDLKKLRQNLSAHKGASHSSGNGGSDKMGDSYASKASNNNSDYKCPFAEEDRMAAKKAAASSGNPEVAATLNKLKKAEDSLYKFMNNFDQPKDLPHEEAIDYFESEREKMTSIKEDVFESIEEGEALLETLE